MQCSASMPTRGVRTRPSSCGWAVRRDCTCAGGASFFRQSPVLPLLVQKHLEVLPPMTRWGCLQDDLARSGVRLPGGLRSLLMAGTSDASGVWLIGNPGRYDASVMVCDSCVKELGARAQNAQQNVGDPSSCLVQCNVFLHGIQNSWTCPRTAWLPTVRGHVSHVGQPAQGVPAFILFSSVCCGDVMHWCAHICMYTVFKCAGRHS